MGILQNYFQKDIVKAMTYYYDQNKRDTIEAKNNNNNNNSIIKNFFVKTIGLVNRFDYGRDVFVRPEFDFDEIRAAIETDSYIKGTTDKHKRLVYKAGYYLKSENEACVEYLKTRFRVMSFATKKPIDVLFQEIANDLISYSNCILIKTRVDKIMPGIKATGIFSDKPVGGYSRIDLSSISIHRDQFGNITGYTQKTINGKEKKYKPEDVIHIYMDKESNNAFGTPKIIAALEDVKLLRKLEGNVLAIVHRFAMPIFHWKIGKPEPGFQATQKEIDEAKAEIESMSIDGSVVTNEKVEIGVIGAEGAAINAAPYLQYFENRVIAALDSSASQMGRGGAKQDADSMEGQCHDYIKFVQSIISIFIENFMLNELLLEGGFNPVTNENDIVYYKFNEINIETKIKVENHEMVKFQSNLQDRNETRRNIGLKEECDEEFMYSKLVEIPAEIEVMQATTTAQADADIKVAKAAPKPVSSTSGSSAKKKSTTGTKSNGKKATYKPNKTATSKNRPSNQHGTTSAKVKEGLHFTEKTIRNKEKHENKYKLFYDLLESLQDDIANDKLDLNEVFDDARVDLTHHISILINKASEEGIRKAKSDLYEMGLEISAIDYLEINYDRLVRDMYESIDNVLEDIKDRLDGNRDFKNIDTVFNSLGYRFRFVLEHILPKATWYSYLIAGKTCGVLQAQVIFGRSEDKEKYPEFIKLDNFELENVPAFHPFCDCKLQFVRQVKK